MQQAALRRWTARYVGHGQCVTPMGRIPLGRATAEAPREYPIGMRKKEWVSCRASRDSTVVESTVLEVMFPRRGARRTKL